MKIIKLNIEKIIYAISIWTNFTIKYRFQCIKIKDNYSI